MSDLSRALTLVSQRRETSGDVYDLQRAKLNDLNPEARKTPAKIAEERLISRIDKLMPSCTA